MESSANDEHSDEDVTYRVVLPEAEMCEAVHKACPLLISGTYLSGSKLNSESDPKSAGSVLIQPIPRFLDCSLYTPGCRQVNFVLSTF